MKKTTRTTLVVLAAAGAVAATAAFADKRQGMMSGMGGEGHGAMLLQEFDTLDADKDGKITPAEIAAQRQARFTAADANADGKLDADELTAFQTARMAERMAARSARMLKWLDANGDGALSADEMPDGPSVDRLARIDTDGDGAISREEADAALKWMSERMKNGKGKKGGKGMMGDDD